MAEQQPANIIRVCKSCNAVKPISLFPENRNKDKKITHRHRCIDCEKIVKSEQNKKYYNKVKKDV